MQNKRASRVRQEFIREYLLDVLNRSRLRLGTYEVLSLRQEEVVSALYILALKHLIPLLLSFSL